MSSAALPEVSKAAADIFYVSPAGDDRWSGRYAEPAKDGTDGPFCSLTHARDCIRTLRVQNKLTDPVTVYLRGGSYTLAVPFCLTPADGGTPAAPVTYSAYQDEKVVISGGYELKGWQAEGSIWSVPLPKTTEGEWRFNQLFINGERKTRARTPNNGYLYTAGPLPGIENPRKQRENPAAKVGFTYADQDVPPQFPCTIFRRWTPAPKP